MSSEATTQLPVPAPEVASAGNRTVAAPECLSAFIMNPRAGSQRVELRNLESVARFLNTSSEEAVRAAGMKADINYIDLGMLARWIEEVLGDTELAIGVRSVVGRDEAFGVAVRDVKPLLVARLGQYAEVLGQQEDKTGPE